jgi:hypothetical protein
MLDVRRPVRVRKETAVQNVAVGGPSGVTRSGRSGVRRSYGLRKHEGFA